jgi:hypothetical protein
LEPPPFGYGIASNQNRTWGELELDQDFFQILVPILGLGSFLFFEEPKPSSSFV